MYTRMLLCFLLINLLVTPAAAKDKALVWQSGTVLDTGRQRELQQVDTTTGYDPYEQAGLESPYPKSSTSEVSYRNIHTVVIEGPEKIYVTEQTKKPFRKVFVPDVNAKVEFAVDKKTLYLKNEKGKKVKTSIVKTILRKPPQP